MTPDIRFQDTLCCQPHLPAIAAIVPCEYQYWLKSPFCQRCKSEEDARSNNNDQQIRLDSLIRITKHAHCCDVVLQTSWGWAGVVLT